MKKCSRIGEINILFFASLLLIFSESLVHSQMGWIQQNPDINQPISKIFFINENTGWASSSGSVPFVSAGHFIKSTNGGNNWFTIITNFLQYKAFTFVNLNTGWLTGYFYDDLGRSSRYIYKSTNGGINWTLQRSDTLSPPFNSIFFLSIDSGWLAGSGGTILKTTSSGLSWFSQAVSNTYNLFSIMFINPNTGWCAGGWNGIILKTTNGGNNWNLQTNFVDKIFYSIFFINESTGWSVGLSGLIAKTTNSGTNWFTQISPTTGNLNSIFFINNNTGWIAGDFGAVLYTSNGGANWVRQTTNTSLGLNSIFFLNNATGWAAGGRQYGMPEGLIIKTTTSGLTFLQPKNLDIPLSFYLYQNYPNPFNPETKIKFSLPLSSKGGGQIVRLVIFDILGREIAILVNEPLKPGTYKVEWDGTNHPSGVYFYRLITEEFTQTKSMVLIK